ncbi:hypothetical protein ACJJTC_012958 [Scirpophaga incertulas]
MFGYTEYKGEPQLRGEVMDWLVTPKTIGEGLCGEARYVDLMYHEAVSFLREWQIPKLLPTLDEWLAAGKWMRGKAGTGKIITITVEGKTKRTRRYKSIDAALYSDDQIRNEMLRATVEKMVIMQKSEGGKIHPVVKTGNEANRKMDYLSELVEKGLEVRNEDSLKVPLDQGGFDQHQSKATIKAVLSAIGDVCVSSTLPGSELRRLWEVLWSSLFGRRVEVIQREKELQVGRAITLGNVCVQGDDVLMTMRDVDDAAILIQGYGEAGYEVHPSNTLFSYERGEFLRRS